MANYSDRNPRAWWFYTSQSMHTYLCSPTPDHSTTECGEYTVRLLAKNRQTDGLCMQGNGHSPHSTPSMY